MIGQCSTSGTISANNRIFVYEVSGLHQNEVTDNCQTPIRSSHTQTLQVPFSRMNEEMRRITMLGGTIVTIRPLNSAAASLEEPA